MKKIYITSLLIFLFGVSSFAQTAKVNLSSEKQLIRGFGGINHPTWYSDLNAAERKLAFGNGEGELGLTVLRTYVSDKSSEWSLGLATTQYAYDQGAYVFATPWNPPAGMTYTDGNGAKHMSPSSYGAYAKHLNDYVSFMRNKGVELYSISVQNEPDYAHEWTTWTPQEGANFIKGYADQIDCKLMTPESFQYRKNIYEPILNDPDVLSKVDIFGTHLYGTLYRDFPFPLFEQKGAGKELWMTEVYTDSKYDGNIWSNTYINDDRHALKVAEHIHYAMVDGNFQAYVFWPLRRYYALIHDGNPDNQGNSPAAAGTATKRGYCMAQFSKWIRPGFVRVDATKSPANNVFVSAYKKDDDVVIVVVNKNTGSKSITLEIPGTKVTSWERYTTSGSKSLAKGTNIEAGSSFQVTLDAASVTTFVGQGNAGFPTVSLVLPDDKTAFALPDAITIDATATDEDGTVDNVFYYINDELVQEEWVAPYAFDWTPTETGVYEIKAVATDNDGNKSESIVTITVNPEQVPYKGTAWPIPGKIEFENYDIGGNGFAYLDNAEDNTGGADFRMDEDVDIEDCTDDGAGYNIGFATAGEWMEYTVDVESAGLYDLVIRAACNGDGRTISISTDGGDIVKDLAIPNTEAWQAWVDVVVKDVELEAGEQILKLTIGEENYVNLNYMTFIRKTPPAEPLQLTKGWNLIGCPLDGATEISTALSSIWGNVLVVKDMDAFYDASQPDFLNSLNSLQWGGGYLVKVDDDCELEW